MLSALGLFVLTALAEIAGCYGVFVVIRQGRSAWWLVPAALSLALFAWLLTLHPTASGRVYAAYGGIYVAVSLLWLWQVDGEALTGSDAIGATVVLFGAGIIVWGGWRT